MTMHADSEAPMQPAQVRRRAYRNLVHSMARVNDETGRAAYDPKVLLNVLRGQRKVSAQWKLFTMVHNIEKVAGVAMRQ